MTDGEAAVAAVAARHGFSRGAVLALAEGLRRGGGGMAQFSHPELGGMGQWSGGDLLQIGAMFDHALKGRVAAALADLAALKPSIEAARQRDPGGEGPWPPELGPPSASGAQGGMRYAFFAAPRRLVLVRDGCVTLYDTAHHRITGVSQSQGRGQHLVFTSAEGAVELGALRALGSESLTKD